MDRTPDHIKISRATPEHIAWAEERLDCDFEPATTGISVHLGDELRAVALYNHWSREGCMAHIVSDERKKWATRGVLYAFFAYPFIQEGRGRITLPIRADNVDAQVFALKLGFGFEGRMRNAIEGQDQIIMGMRRDECRWILEANSHG